MKERLFQLKGYGIALLISSFAILLKFILEPILMPHTFLLSIAAVTLSSWFGGIGPGLLATAIAAWANHTFFLSSDDIAVSGKLSDLVRITIFIGVAMLINSVNARLRAASARAEAAALQAQAAFAEAEAANRAKDEFLAMVSHELRTPLTAILGWIEIAKSDAANAALTAQALDVIQRSAKTQAQLIEDLLDVSRIIAGKLKLDFSDTNPIVVVRAALDTVRPAAAAKKITLELQADNEIGSISADVERLQQVVWNLLTNAIKFTPEGGRVQVILRREEDFAAIVVRDYGKGIKPDFLPFVFERFRQAENNRVHGGLGLGLAIVRHLVEMHGGEVKAESEGIGKGTTFTVRLPLVKETHVPLTGRVPALVLHSGQLQMPAALDGLKVLVVDDEPEARIALASMLRKCGADVLTASSASDALNLLDRWPPDVIVSDLGMPGEDGYELLRKLRAQTGRAAKLPVIALTAYAGLESRLKAIAAGFQDFLTKPIQPEKLALAIKNLTLPMEHR
jgi:signal transduction histidine kinase/ActR/RegA family two-component response regulator